MEEGKGVVYTEGDASLVFCLCQIYISVYVRSTFLSMSDYLNLHVSFFVGAEENFDKNWDNGYLSFIERSKSSTVTVFCCSTIR